MDLIQILSAAGIGGVLGSLLTTIVQSWLTNKSNIATRNFQEKKEAYMGLLDAMYKSEVDANEAGALYCGLCINKAELVASKQVILLLAKFRKTNPVGGSIHPERPQVMAQLKEAMRKDLGVDLNNI